MSFCMCLNSSPENPLLWPKIPYIHEYSKLATVRHDLHSSTGARIMSILLAPKDTDPTLRWSLTLICNIIKKRKDLPQDVKDAFASFEKPETKHCILISIGTEKFQATEEPHIFFAPDISEESYMTFNKKEIKCEEGNEGHSQQTCLVVGGVPKQFGECYYCQVPKEIEIPEVKLNGWRVTSGRQAGKGFRWLYYERCKNGDGIEVTKQWLANLANSNFKFPEVIVQQPTTSGGPPPHVQVTTEQPRIIKSDEDYRRASAYENPFGGSSPRMANKPTLIGALSGNGDNKKRNPSQSIIHVKPKQVSISATLAIAPEASGTSSLVNKDCGEPESHEQFHY